MMNIMRFVTLKRKLITILGTMSPPKFYQALFIPLVLEMQCYITDLRVTKTILSRELSLCTSFCVCRKIQGYWCLNSSRGKGNQSLLLGTYKIQITLIQYCDAHKNLYITCKNDQGDWIRKKKWKTSTQNNLKFWHQQKKIILHIDMVVNNHVCISILTRSLYLQCFQINK